MLSSPVMSAEEELNPVSPRPAQNRRISLEGRPLLSKPFPLGPEVFTSPAGPAPATAAAEESIIRSPPPAFRFTDSGGGKERGTAVDVRRRPRDEAKFPKPKQTASLPNGATGELLRQVAALDVTRMTCEQVRTSTICW